ncbi:hypothetical protein H0H93_014180 [Arthromyces matolae]|nr:hypothetical protein H0H93_014180 [Arthromyces matolae]
MASIPDSKYSRVLIFGSGNFGSCLASHLGDTQHDVYMWAREASIVSHFNKYHRNPMYLRDHQFPSNITAVGPEMPTQKLLDTMDVLLFAIPTQFLRENLKILHPRLNPEKMPLLIFVNKGIEIETHALTLEIIADTCGAEVAKAATFISGLSLRPVRTIFCKRKFVDVVNKPTHIKVVERQPTSVSVASFTESEANKASVLFHQPHFRCYTGADPIGIELAGALKNVYAIASGMSDGLGFENNTRAMGYRLGKGETLDTITKTLGSVAEGVSTAKGVKKIIDELGVNAPIASSVYDVLYNGKDAKTAVKELMSLPPSRELELPPTAGGPARQLLRKLGLE